MSAATSLPPAGRSSTGSRFGTGRPGSKACKGGRWMDRGTQWHWMATEGLYIGGSFTQVGALRSPGIAHWNGKAWDDPDGLADSLAKQQRVSNQSTSAGSPSMPQTGSCMQVGLIRLNNHAFLAIWKQDKPGWSMIPINNNEWVGHLALDPLGGLYVAGQNELAAGSNGIARYSKGRWSGLSGGLTRFGSKSGSGQVSYDHFSIVSMAVDRARAGHHRWEYSCCWG